MAHRLCEIYVMFRQMTCGCESGFCRSKSVRPSVRHTRRHIDSLIDCYYEGQIRTHILRVNGTLRFILKKNKHAVGCALNSYWSSTSRYRFVRLSQRLLGFLFYENMIDVVKVSK